MQFVVFWNINWLKERLRQKPLSGQETYLYLLCWLVFLTLFFFPENINDSFSHSGWLEVIELSIPFIAIFYAWLCNGGRQGEQFWTRLISIGWVVTMRTLVFCLPVFLILALAPMEQSELIYESAATLAGLFIIWRLGSHIEGLRDVNKKTFL
ncbi:MULTISPECIES: hypothetical protein [unclassified Endozoicomonas]|uniref:hypothetical protein n=1 Tax=unclassified Endozoicomonas TaxID=2644528 RepID=UPI0021483968|nr:MULTISPECIES: hypothetical protein [unclassified Endozoicomonas]